MKCGYELLHSFRKSEVFNKIILSAEKFLVERILKTSERNNFDDIRLGKLPPISSYIHIHIKRIFLQCYVWLHAPFFECIEISIEDYGL